MPFPKKKKPDKYFVHVGAMRPGHKLREASQEEIEEIFNMYKEDRDNDTKRFYWLNAGHPARLRKLHKEAKSKKVKLTD